MDTGADRLAEGWTPEQIAGWLKAGHERDLRALGFEAIYAFVYRTARKGEALWRYLTRRHKRRRPRRAKPSRDRIKDRAGNHLGHARRVRADPSRPAQIHHVR